MLCCRFREQPVLTPADMQVHRGLLTVGWIGERFGDARSDQWCAVIDGGLVGPGEAGFKVVFDAQYLDV